MKTAVKILVIIAAVIGIIWAIVGFFGMAIGGGFLAAFEETEEAVQEIVEPSVMTMMKLVGSFVVIIAGLIFGVIASGKETKPVAGIVLSALLIVCGISATVWASYIAGPLYILCGILGLVANATAKRSTA